LNYGVWTNRQFQIVDECQIASDTILRDRLLFVKVNDTTLLRSTIYDVPIAHRFGHSLALV
jgi:hypothetical protein